MDGRRLEKAGRRMVKDWQKVGRKLAKLVEASKRLAKGWQKADVK
jgi:hypothetical protein